MSLLDKSIADAKLLREAALKEAEKTLTEKHRLKIAEAVAKLLESEENDEEVEEMLGSTDETKPDVSLLEGEVEDKMSDAQTGDDEVVELDLQKLEEMVKEALDKFESSEILQEFDTHEEVADSLQEETSMSSSPVEGAPVEDETLQESEENPETSKEELEHLFLEEETTKDCGCALNEECSHYSDLVKENEELEEAKLQLETKLMRYSKALQEARQHISRHLLENAKLTYQNKILIDETLSEPQKRSLVESIGKATSVEKAKMIFEIRPVAGNKPKSLHESVGINGKMRSSMVLTESKKKTEDIDPAFARMQQLAGIVKKEN